MSQMATSLRGETVTLLTEGIRRIYRRAMYAHAIVMGVAAVLMAFSPWPLLAVLSAWFSGYAFVNAGNIGGPSPKACGSRSNR